MKMVGLTIDHERKLIYEKGENVTKVMYMRTEENVNRRRNEYGSTS